MGVDGLLEQSKDDDGLALSGYSRNSKKWFDSVNTLKVETTGFAQSLDMRYEKRSGVKEDIKNFG